MITTGIIKEINLSSSNYIGNKYKVELNIFRIPGDQSKSKYSYIANCMVPGGISANLQVGDLVYVGFLNDDKGYPIILGKIYQGLATKPAGHAYFDSLQVDKTVLLPKTTTIGDFSYPELESKFKQLALVQDVNSTLVEFSNRIDIEIRDQLKPAVKSASEAATKAQTAANSAQESVKNLENTVTYGYRQMIPLTKDEQEDNGEYKHYKVYIEGPGKPSAQEKGEESEEAEEGEESKETKESSSDRKTELIGSVTINDADMLTKEITPTSVMFRDQYGRTQVANGVYDYDAVNYGQLKTRREIIEPLELPSDESNDKNFYQVYVEGPGEQSDNTRVQKLRGCVEISKSDDNENLSLSVMLRDKDGKSQVIAGDQNNDVVNFGQLTEEISKINLSNSDSIGEITNSIDGINKDINDIKKIDTVANSAAYIKETELESELESKLPTILPEILDSNTNKQTSKEVIQDIATEVTNNILDDNNYISDTELADYLIKPNNSVENNIAVFSNNNELKDSLININNIVEKAESATTSGNFALFDADGKLCESDISSGSFTSLQTNINASKLYQHSLLFDYSRYYDNPPSNEGAGTTQDIFYSISFRIDIITADSDEIKFQRSEDGDSGVAEYLFNQLIIDNNRWDDNISTSIYPIRSFQSTGQVVNKDGTSAYFPISVIFYINALSDADNTIQRRLHLRSYGDPFAVRAQDDITFESIDIDIDIENIDEHKYTEVKVTAEGDESTESETNTATSSKDWCASVLIRSDKITELKTINSSKSDNQA